MKVDLKFVPYNPLPIIVTERTTKLGNLNVKKSIKFNLIFVFFHGQKPLNDDVQGNFSCTAAGDLSFRLSWRLFFPLHSINYVN